MPYRCWNQELIVSHMLSRRTSYTKTNWLINYLLQCVWRMTDARMLPPWLHRWSSIHTPSCTVVIFVVLAVFTFINGKMELHFFTGSERSQASTHFPTFHIYWPTCEHGEKKNYPSSLIKMWTWRKQIALPHILSRFNLSMNARKFYMKDTWASSPVPCQVCTFGNSVKNMNNRWSVHPKGNGSNSY